jgi:hypothetical protein
MLKRLGLFFGIAFLFGGILGFVPGVIKDGMYFGIFMVNTPHNILHIVSGVIFIIASMVGPRAARLWFQMFGIVYAAMALWGLKVGTGMICGVISNNRYDAWGHAVLALAMLLIGFATQKHTNLLNARHIQSTTR